MGRRGRKIWTQRILIIQPKISAKQRKKQFRHESPTGAIFLDIPDCTITILVPFSLNLFPGMLFSPPGEETETLGTRLFNRYVQWSSERRRSALITVDKTTLITVDKSARKRFFWQDRPRMEDIISDVVITSQLRWHMENRHSLVRSEKNPLTSLEDSKVVCSSPYACAK